MATVRSNAYCINLRRTIRMPYERVCRALMNPEEIPLWLQPPLQLEFHVGGRFYTHEGMPIAEVVDYFPLTNGESGQRWGLRWISPLNQPGSKVTLEIVRAARAATRLNIRHWLITSEKDYHELYSGWLWFLDSLEHYFTSNKYLQYDYPDVFGR